MVCSFLGMLYKTEEICHYLDPVYNIMIVCIKTYLSIKPTGKGNELKDHWSRSMELKMLLGLYRSSTRD